MEKKNIEKLTCEIRFKPDPTFLDKRGQVAGAISKNSTFLHWNIDVNKIIFFGDSNKNIKAQVSYKDLTVVSLSPNSRSFLVGNLDSIIENSWDYLSYKKITRIGVRSIFFIEVNNFKEIFDLIKKKFLLDDSCDFISKNLYDIGLSFNFSNGKSFSHVSIGPMEEKQIKENFDEEKRKDVPKNALYIDVDSFITTVSPNISKKELIDLTKKFFIENEGIKEKIIKKIWQK